jgi:hypothetical protein
VPDTAPTPVPPYADGTGLPWDVTVVDAVAASATRGGATVAGQRLREQPLLPAPALAADPCPIRYCAVP